MSRQRSLRQRAWEKSQGVCCLCGLPMIPDVLPPDPLAFTLEHIIPKCQGGTNDMENLDGSHQWCNNWKGDVCVSELPSGWRRVLRWKIKHLLINRSVKPERKK